MKNLCELCGREVALTDHHLIPRMLHRRKRYQNNCSRAELTLGTIALCRLCHRGIHTLYDEVTLAEQFNSLAKLKADPAIAKHCSWVAKQKQL